MIRFGQLLSFTVDLHVSTALATLPQAVPVFPGDRSHVDMRNPADLGFPPMLPVELALKIAPPAGICGHYGISREQFAEIIAHPVFVKAYQEAVEALKVDGMSFRLKARMQGEHYLTTSYAMVTNPATSDAVRADLIKQTIKWAGLEPKNNEPAGGGGGFNIMINLGV